MHAPQEVYGRVRLLACTTPDSVGGLRLLPVDIAVDCRAVYAPLQPAGARGSVGFAVAAQPRDW